jgi:hypothetical protein
VSCDAFCLWKGGERYLLVPTELPLILNYAVVFRKVEVPGGDDVDTKSSSVKSSSGKVKTTKQQAIESEPDLPSNSIKHLFDNITPIGPGEQPTLSKPPKGITKKKDKQDVVDEMALNDSLDDEEVPTTPTKQGAANPKRVKLGANKSTPIAILRVNTRASARQRV